MSLLVPNKQYGIFAFSLNVSLRYNIVEPLEKSNLEMSV